MSKNNYNLLHTGVKSDNENNKPKYRYEVQSEISKELGGFIFGEGVGWGAGYDFFLYISLSSHRSIIITAFVRVPQIKLQIIGYARLYVSGENKGKAQYFSIPREPEIWDYNKTKNYTKLGKTEFVLPEHNPKQNVELRVYITYVYDSGHGRAVPITSLNFWKHPGELIIPINLVEIK